MGTQKALDLNVAAIHVSPIKAREMIRHGARSAVGKVGSVERFWIDPPYQMVRISRPDEEGMVQKAVNNSEDFIDLISQPAQSEKLAGTGHSGV